MLVEILNKTTEAHKSSGKFSISQIDTCKRKMYKIFKGEFKEEYDEKTFRNFDIGNAFHMMIVKNFMEKSTNSCWKVCAAELNIKEHPFISGRTDLMLCNSDTGDKILVDIKSCSVWSMNEAKDGRVSDGYIKQLQLYLHFFNINRGYILFVNKNNGDLFEYEVIYNKELCENLIKEIENFMINNVAAGVEPPRCKGEGMFPCQCCKDK